MYNFITKHIIDSIERSIKEKKSILNLNQGFCYLDEPIKTRINRDISINRVDKYAYAEGEVMPISWYIIKESDLLKIYKALKENKFFVNREIGGVVYKSRLKKEI